MLYMTVKYCMCDTVKKYHITPHHHHIHIHNKHTNILAHIESSNVYVDENSFVLRVLDEIVVFVDF